MSQSFSLIRDGVTATCVTLDVEKIDYLRRWIVSSMRHSGVDVPLYHFVAYGNLQDISGTDSLNEITGTLGRKFKIVNKREVVGSHLEFDLEIV